MTMMKDEEKNLVQNFILIILLHLDHHVLHS